MHALLSPAASEAVPVHCLDEAGLEALLPALTSAQRTFLAAQGFEAKPGRVALVPEASGALGLVLFGVESEGAAGRDPFLLGKLPAAVPAGLYRLATPPADPAAAVLAVLMAQYRFTRYRKGADKAVRLVVPEGVDGEEVSRIAEAVAFGRDLVNTPANDLGPAELELAARSLAARFGAAISVTTGAALLAANLPMIHAVGMGSPRAPRLIDITWGDPAHPKVTLVGKGVCFDTGGLDIKPDSAMLLMKKDMGGAAAALAGAMMIMGAGLKVRLRVLVPAVENAVSGEAFRPGDVFMTRKGLSVEIGNTDAEGRLVLADALALGDEDAPDLMMDFATLTGAARVALGPDLPPVYSEDEGFIAELLAKGTAVNDPLWRLPLWAPYASGLDSKIADLNNVTSGGFAGSITAALFLKRFVEKAKTWCHADIYAWVPSEKAGRPQGGEVQAARALYALLKARYG